MITPDQMTAIIKARKLQIIPVGDIGWVARTVEGSRAGPKHSPYLTPEEAVEAAELWFVAAAARDTDTKAARIIAAIERGRYFIRVRNQTSVDSEGNPVTVKLFSAILPNGNTTPVTDRSSYVQAVIDMEALLP